MSYADGLVDSLERFTCGAILVDWLGRVIRLNGRAETALGDHLQLVASRLRSPQRETNKALQDLIDASIAHSHHVMNLVRDLSCCNDPRAFHSCCTPIRSRSRSVTSSRARAASC